MLRDLMMTLVAVIIAVGVIALAIVALPIAFAGLTILCILGIVWLIYAVIHDQGLEPEEKLLDGEEDERR